MINIYSIKCQIKFTVFKSTRTYFTVNLELLFSKLTYKLFRMINCYKFVSLFKSRFKCKNN